VVRLLRRRLLPGLLAVDFLLRVVALPAPLGLLGKAGLGAARATLGNGKASWGVRMEAGAAKQVRGTLAEAALLARVQVLVVVAVVEGVAAVVVSAV
jgi:hypothetical protein